MGDMAADCCNSTGDCIGFEEVERVFGICLHSVRVHLLLGIVYAWGDGVEANWRSD